VILYFLFLFLVPFQEHPILGAPIVQLPSFPITAIKLVGILLVGAALLLPRPRDAAPRPSAGIILLFGTFAMYQVLGTTLSSSSFPSTDASTLFSFAILMFATNLLISTKHRLQMTIRVIVLVQTFASTWLYKQYYLYHWARPMGPSNDPNYEALSLVLTVPLAVWLARYELRDLWKWTGRICTPILAFAVFVSQSRGGLLALMVVIALAWMSSRHKVRLVATFTLGAALMLALAPGQMIDRLQHIRFQGQAQTGAEFSTRSRVELVRAGIRIIEAHPLFGVGLEHFQSVEYHYNPLLISLELNPHVAHNTYIQLGAEGGIPTLALYLAILAVTLMTCGNAQKLQGVPEDLAALALSFQVGLIGIMVAEFFLTGQYVKIVWVLISLTPNLYAISVHAAEATAKSVAVQPQSATPIVLRPRLRTG
jgi:O-antigen ligase